MVGILETLMKYIVNSKPSDRGYVDGLMWPSPERRKRKIRSRIRGFDSGGVGVSALARSVRAKALGLAGKK